MPAISTSPLFIVGPEENLAAVDVYKDDPTKVKAISTVQKIDDYLISVDSGIGNKWDAPPAVTPAQEVPPDNWGQTKTIELTGDAIKKAVLTDSGAAAAFSQLDKGLKSVITGEYSIKKNVSNVQQIVNGKIKYINSLAAPTIDAMQKMVNSLYGTMCSPLLKDKAATITFTTNFLKLAQLHKIAGMLACIMSSPLLHPDTLLQVVKNMIPHIKLAGDIDGLKALCFSEHAKLINRTDPDFFRVFLHNYKIPTNEDSIDYIDLYEEVVSSFLEGHPTWGLFTRNGEPGWSDCADIAYASDDFKKLLKAKATNIFYDIDGADPETFDLASNTAKEKYWYAVAKDFPFVNTKDEIARLYLMVKAP